MLITLVDIEDEQSLRQAQEKAQPAVYATSVCAFAEELAGRGLPCIFAAETEDAAIYGADLVICGKEDGWRRDEKLLERVYRRHYGLPWTIAETERLRVRESVMEDLPYFLAMYAEERGNPDVRPFSEQPEEELYSYIRNRYPFYGYGLWSVIEKESGRVVGRAGLEETETPKGETAPELSYLIEKGSRGRGYAKEAARAVLAYARAELGMKEALLRASFGNTASRSLAVSLGFRRISGLQNYFKIDLTSRLM